MALVVLEGFGSWMATFDWQSPKLCVDRASSVARVSTKKCPVSARRAWHCPQQKLDLGAGNSRWSIARAWSKLQASAGATHAPGRWELAGGMTWLRQPPWLGARRHKPFYHSRLSAGADRDRRRHRARTFLSGARRADEAVGRRLHQADQDADRADHLLHRRARHRQHAGHEEGRPRRPQGAALLRGHDHAGVDRRPDRHQRAAARRRHERRRQDARHQGDPALRRQVQGAEHASTS